jgi:tripartite-type tricarboxylate transporter receptor subunit TctC
MPELEERMTRKDFRGAGLRTLLLSAGFALLAPQLLAQEAYPTRPITLVVPFAAGGATDALARLIAEPMSRDLGHQVVIENVAGAGGTVGSARAAKANPDGYTILLGHAGTHAASVGFYKKLPYDPVEDYEQIGEAGDAPQILIVNKELPVKDLKEFAAYVEQNQDQVSFGTAGVGSAAHLGGMMLNAKLGTNVKAVSYRGLGTAMTDLIAGRISYMVDVSTSALPQIQGGTVRPIAVMRSTRIAALPDLPASPESGIPGLDFSVWNVLLAPKGTPRPIVERLNAALRKATSDEKVRSRYKDLAIELPDEVRMTPEGARSHMKAEVEKWLPIVRATGLTLD